jgi:hypothetical protein
VSSVTPPLSTSAGLVLPCQLAVRHEDRPACLYVRHDPPVHRPMCKITSALLPIPLLPLRARASQTQPHSDKVNAMDWKRLLG